MKKRVGMFANLEGQFLKRWWIVVAVGVLMITTAGVLVAIFPHVINVIINKEITLVEGGRAYNWWKNPPVTPQMHIYIYNVTNSNQFLNESKKPMVQELGPYVYLETWEKVNVEFNPNGTVSYNLKKRFIFSKELSHGSEDDLVVVPNIPLLTATSKSKRDDPVLKRALSSILGALKVKPFVEVTVGKLLWGYEDPLIKLANTMGPSGTKLPFDLFGLLWGKNGTSKDNYTIFTGASNINKYGLLDKVNGKARQGHWTTPQCDSVMGSDGSIFPPQITKHTELKIFEKDLCRSLPLVYKKEVISNSGVSGFRFVPTVDSFSSPERVPSQQCYCPAGAPCAPEGTFNASSCQHDSPILLSFPHFYLADPALRKAILGMTPPEEDKHQLYIDVQPTLGMAMRARYRMQINLAVSQAPEFKKVASFPDIVFPIMWFEDRIDDLPEEITSVIKMAIELPPLARIMVSGAFAAIGLIILVGAVICLVRTSHNREKLYLSNILTTSPKSNNGLSSDIQNLSVKSADNPK